MSKHIFEIGDSDGHSFKISIELPFNRTSKGSWRTLDKGLIRYNSGKTIPTSGYGGSDDDILLVSSEGTWGLKLDDYQDFWGLNDEGTGEVLQRWALQIKPGKISWALV